MSARSDAAAGVSRHAWTILAATAAPVRASVIAVRISSAPSRAKAAAAALLAACISVPAAAADISTTSAAPSPPAAAAPRGTISIRDDQGRTVTLPRPALRAVSLAPHGTELAYAAGAGDRLVGTARGSDYPPAARVLPSVGDGLAPDPERVAALRPDLVIGWLPGGAAPLLPVLRALDVPIYYSDPRTLRDIPGAVEHMGVLFGTQAVAAPAAAALRARIDALAARYAGRRPVRVFIQAGRDPIYTLNSSSIVSDALRVCGGVNVFADAPVTAPQVTREAVLAARPDAVVAGVSEPASLAATTAAWRALQLPAALAGHVIGIDADALYRPGPRLIDATERLCTDLDQARGVAGTPAPR